MQLSFIPALKYGSALQHKRTVRSPRSRARKRSPGTHGQPAMQVLRGLQFFALGYAHFGHRGYAARKRSFSPGALDVDLSGRHYVVTGASSGLGRAAAEALAARGGTVHLVCRGKEKAQSVADGIAAAGGTAVVHVCDLSSLRDVERFASTWGMHVLIVLLIMQVY
eukprot:IDg13525t1